MRSALESSGLSGKERFQARKLGSNLGGTATSSGPTTTYSQYLKPTSTGTESVNRGGQDNVNAQGNMQQQYNPYSFMGNFGNSWMAAPNAMDSFSSKYGPGATPEWAKPGWKPDYIKQQESAEAAKAAATQGKGTPSLPAGQAYASGNEALNAVNSKLSRALTPEETQQLQSAIGYTGGAVTQDQMNQIQGLLKQHRPDLLGMGSIV